MGIETMTKGQALQVQEKKEVSTKNEKTVPARYFVPLTDIFENDEALTVVMEMPGVEKKDLEVHVEDEVLRVEGRIDFSKYENLEPHYAEYNVGHYARSFAISNKIDTQRINAALEDGVLTLKLPKVEQARPRRIPIG
jgi:HSP20 family molecular chaperone IbpA